MSVCATNQPNLLLRLEFEHYSISMATSPSNSNKIDHLSILPDALLQMILSFLPTDIAAQTSILCRRFRHLWEASPSLNLICRNHEKFLVMTDRALHRRDPSNTLIRLHLDLWYLGPASLFLSFLLSKAHSLRLSHLTIEGFEQHGCSSVLCVLFSMDTLKSLSLDGFPRSPIFPSEITLTSLRSLSLRLDRDDLAILNLLPKLCSLKYLKLYLYNIPKLSLSCRTIRNLELIIDTSILNTVQLCLPSLELLHLKTEGLYHHQSLPHFHGEVPLLKKVVIDLFELRGEYVRAVHGLLDCISHVEEMALHIQDHWHEKCPIPILLEPGKDAPNFFNLKHLNVTVCFHCHNLEAVAAMLHHSPALESINLVHEVPKFTWEGSERKRKNWESRLPRNDDGNYRYAHIRNLHLGDNRKRFMKLISKKYASKRQESE